MKKISLLLLILIVFQGCQLIRLKQFQDQLKDPKTAIRFKNNTVHLNDPVLEPEDIMWINGNTKPSVKEKIGQTESWTYNFKKKNGTEDLKIQLIFNQKKLTKLNYPKQLSKLFETYLINKAFESISSGAYNSDHNSLSPGRVRSYDKTRLPEKKDVIQRLGQPSAATNNQTEANFNYTYIIEGSNKEAVMNFDFSEEKLKRISGNLFGPYLSFRIK